MKLLTELLDGRTAQLTHTQLSVLILMKQSASPELAYEATVGTRNINTASDILKNLGIISIRNNKAEITPTGHELLKSQALFDDEDNLTERGQEILNDFNRSNTVAEAYSLIKQL